MGQIGPQPGGLIPPGWRKPQTSATTQLATTLSALEARGVSSLLAGPVGAIWSHGIGANIFDVEDNVYIDVTAGFGVAVTGYSHLDVVAAIHQQVPQLMHCMTGIFPHAGYADTLDAIARSVGRTPAAQVLMTCTGSEAVEVACKLALRHTERSGILAFYGGFHGQTLGALALTGHTGLREPFARHLGHFVTFVPYPDLYRPPAPFNSVNVGEGCLALIESVLRSPRSGSPPIGAVLVEPLQNLTGYVVPPAHFLPGLRQLCDAYGVLLIADEVFSGFGRTGAWLACDRANVVPDIACVGKGMTGGLPAAACVADKAVMQGLVGSAGIPLHGSTFMANPLACAAIKATVNIIERDGMLARAESIGRHLMQGFRPLMERHTHVGDVRGMGAAVAIDFVTNQSTKEPAPAIAKGVVAALLEHGVIALSSGMPYGNAVTFCPPLVIEAAQLDYVVAAVADALQSTLDRLGL